MHDLPRYIEALANLRRDQEYGDLKKQLTTPAKAALLPVMAFRFWCHAHIYSLVFPLIIYDIIDDREKEALSHLAHYLPQTLGQSWLPLFKITLTLLIVALGSLSFAFFDLLGGVIADKNGCKPAILFGLLGMIVLMLFFAGTTYFSTGKTALILLMVGQIFVGLPLALIDNADTVLTDKIATAQGLNQSDEKYLEGICVKLKYSGLAVASTIGCFLYMFAGPMLKKNGASTGAFIFLITAALQGLAIWKLKLVGEPDSESTELVSKGLLIRFRDAAASVYAERVLGIWVLISAITEGWLLFAAVYFQFGALANLRASAGSSRILLLMIPLAYYLVSRLASEGGGHFNRWLKARLAKDTNTAFRLRHGSILETSRVRLVAAITILAVMSAVFVGHLIVTMVFTESVLNSNYILSLLSLVFYGVYQFIRGFSSPLLRTTLKNHAKEKSISDLTATLSFATGVGRLFHALVTLLFTICLILVIVQSPGKDNPASSLKNGIPDAIKALAATIVVTVLVIVVLNFLANILLDRKKKHSSAFDLEDFKNVTGLIKKLNEPEAPLAVYLRSQFSPLTRNLLEQARTSERPSEALKEALVDELNRIIVSPGLYDRDRFAEVRLTAATKASIEQSLQDEDLARQNRVLLEEA